MFSVEAMMGDTPQEASPEQIQALNRLVAVAAEKLNSPEATTRRIVFQGVPQQKWERSVRVSLENQQCTYVIRRIQDDKNGTQFSSEGGTFIGGTYFDPVEVLTEIQIPSRPEGVDADSAYFLRNYPSHAIDRLAADLQKAT